MCLNCWNSLDFTQYGEINQSLRNIRLQLSTLQMCKLMPKTSERESFRSLSLTLYWDSARRAAGSQERGIESYC